MLDPFSRGAIVGLSAFCVAGALALAPLRARSSIDDGAAPPPRLASAARSGVAPAGPIVRDPFAEPVIGDRAPSAAAGTSVVSNAPPATPTTGIVPLPSNLANDTIPALPGAAADGDRSQARVTALVTGAHPYAMIEMGGVHDIKGLGDRVAGVPIVSIDLDGVRLQTGERLSVDHGAKQ